MTPAEAREGVEVTRVEGQVVAVEARDTRLDNLKGLLIALVVLGHAVEPFRARFAWVATLYAFVYLFHMPMFAYASGVVSRRELGAEQLRGILEKLVLPYVALDIAYRLFDYVVFERPTFELALLSPFWILWYFVSLIWWRLLLPLLALTRYPLLIAVAFSLCAGLYRYENNFAFARTFVFLPFFVLGHYHHRRLVRSIDERPWARAAALVLLCGALLLVGAYLPESFNVRWLYGGESFKTLGVSWQAGMPTRLLISCASIVIGVAVLAATPRGPHPLARYGAHSMTIYVLHAIPIKLCLVAGLYQRVQHWHQALLVMAASLALLPILVSGTARELAHRLMHPSGRLREFLLLPDGKPRPDAAPQRSAPPAASGVCPSPAALLPPEAR